jgi:hypothetical protein
MIAEFYPGRAAQEQKCNQVSAGSGIDALPEARKVIAKKKFMKKIIITLGIILLAGNARGQGIPVVDFDHIAQSAIHWAISIEKEFVKNQEMIKIRGLMLDALNLYQKFNTDIDNSTLVFSVMKKQVDFYNLSNKYLSLDDKLIADRDLFLVLQKNIISLQDENEDNLILIRSYLKEDMFKMNDSERIAAVERVETKIDKLHSILNIEVKKFNNINSKLQFLNLSRTSESGQSGENL